MRKLFVILTFIMAGGWAASAQDYNWGVGARVGGEMVGATVKYKFDATNAVEGLLAFPWDGGFTFTGLYERHVPIIMQGFNLYFGGGAHTGSWDHHFSIGIDGIIGLEYKLQEVPLVFSVDYRPMIEFAANDNFPLLDFAFSMRVTF